MTLKLAFKYYFSNAFAFLLTNTRLLSFTFLSVAFKQITSTILALSSTTSLSLNLQFHLHGLHNSALVVTLLCYLLRVYPIQIF